jgi:hypothetical protein
MGNALLHTALAKGAPLVDISLTFVQGIDYSSAANQLNGLADDFHLLARPPFNNPRLRNGSATKEALERLFAWKLKRVPLERYDERTKTWALAKDAFRWEEVTPPQSHPLPGLIESIEMVQPGADDNGQWYE